MSKTSFESLCACQLRVCKDGRGSVACERGRCLGPASEQLSHHSLLHRGPKTISTLSNMLLNFNFNILHYIIAKCRTSLVQALKMAHVDSCSGHLPGSRRKGTSSRWLQCPPRTVSAIYSKLQSPTHGTCQGKAQDRLRTY